MFTFMPSECVRWKERAGLLEKLQEESQLEQLDRPLHYASIHQQRASSL